VPQQVEQPEERRVIQDRAERLLAGVDIDRETGLEIGPLDKPLVPRVGSRPIFYADYAPREVLQQRSSADPEVDVLAIPNIDYIIQPLPSELDRRFDYIIASHVAEHVPDLIGWIKTLCGWLNPDGRLILAIPDKRHCFDILRNPSTAGELLEAFLEHRPAPRFASIYDAMRLAVRIDQIKSWTEEVDTEALARIFSPEAAFYTAEQARLTGRYQDCHCWVFTHGSFLAAIEEVNLVSDASIRVLRSEPPVWGSNEFHVVLNWG
jgi:SAM-dependent methyltransferase